MSTKSRPLIRGSGKGGGGTPYTPKEEVNTLKSKSFVRVLDLLGWGEWEGPVRDTPGTSKTCDVVAGNRHIGCTTSGLTVGQTVQGPGIQAGTLIESIDGGGLFFTADQDPTYTDPEATLLFGASSGAESILLDDTPLVNSDGSTNFTGIKWAQTLGTQDQGYIPGFETVENYVTVNTKVRTVSAVTRTITNSDCDKVIVEVRLPQLYERTDKGDAVASSVEVGVYIKLNSGSFELAKRWIIEGKNVADYLEQTELTLPKSTTPATDTWQVRVTRVTPDHDGSSKFIDTVYFNAYTEVTTKKFRYPNMVIGALEADSQNLDHIPVRSRRMRMMKIQVPANYDPATRTYATTGTGTTGGGWDGTFKVAYSNCPPWVAYDLCRNKNYGLGKYIDITKVDKWTLYDIGVYCDVMVPDGNGGTEPRFAANFYLPTQEEAMKVLSDVVSIGRMMVYYGKGTLNFVQDKPKASFTAFTNSDVKDGRFNYPTTGKRARKTVAFVRFNDPDNFYRPAIQPYEDYEGIFRYGWNPVDVAAFGTTSRGQAFRYGAMLIGTEIAEYEGCTFITSVRGHLIKPGMLLDIFDERRQNIENGGKVVATAGTTSVTLDKPVEIESGKTYTLTLVIPAAIVESSDITNSTQTSTIDATQLVGKTVNNSVGTATIITVTTAFSSVPIGATWILTSNTLSAQKIRVLSVEEVSPTEFQISGNKYAESKFDATEIDPDFEIPPVLYFPTDRKVPPVENLTLVPRTVTTPEGISTWLDIGWTLPSTYTYYSSFRVSYSFENGPFVQLTEVFNPGHTFKMETPGLYVVRVTAISNIGKGVSIPAQESYTLEDANPVGVFRVTGLEIQNNGSGSNYFFNGKDVRFIWRVNSPARFQNMGSETNGAQDGIRDPYFGHYLVQVFNTDGELVYSERTLNSFFTYTYEVNRLYGTSVLAAPYRNFKFKVIPVDRYENQGIADSITVNNLTPDLPTLETSLLIGAVNFKFSFPSDPDFRGYKIWASTVNGFTPSDANLVYDGPDSQPTVKLLADTLWYYRYGAYDAFGTTGMTVSDQASVTTVNLLDTTPPAVPVGLALTTASEISDSGLQRVRITAKFTPNSESDLFSYGWSIRRASSGYFAVTGQTHARTDSGGFVQSSEGKVTFDWFVSPGDDYEVKVNAIDQSGNASAYTDLATITSAADTTVPTTPVWVSATYNYGLVTLHWAASPDPDFNHFDLWYNSTNDFGTASLQKSTARNSAELQFVSTGLTTAATKYFWLVAYDHTGNASATSAVQTLANYVLSPVSVSLASVSELDEDGTAKVYLDATWSASGDTQVISYTLEVSLTSGGTAILTKTVTGTSARFQVIGNTTYYVRLRVNNNSSGFSAWSSVVGHTTVKDTTVPTSPTDITELAGIRSLFLQWTPDTVADYLGTAIYRSVDGAPFPSDDGDEYAFVTGNAWTDNNCVQGSTYQYYFKGVDTSGNYSTSFSTSAIISVGKAETSDINDFAVTLTKQYTATVALASDAWTNDSNDGTPGSLAGNIHWNAHTLYYRGVAHSVASGTTAFGYVYWDAASPTAYLASATNPALTDGQFMIATNVLGVHDLAWNAMANALIGTAYIQNLAVTNGKILSLAVDKLTAGSITSQSITLAATTVTYSSGLLTVGEIYRITNAGGTFTGVGAANNTVGTEFVATGTTPTWGTGQVQHVTSIRSSAYSPGVAGFKIDGAGRLFAMEAVIKGGVTIGTPSASGLYLGSDKIGFFTSASGGSWPTYIDSSGNMVLGTKLQWDAGLGVLSINGYIEVRTGTTYLDNIATTISGGNITTNTIAADRLTATLTMTNELIMDYSGGTGSKIHSVTSTNLTTGTGFWIAKTASSAEFRFGDPSGQHIKWDGSTLTIAGGVTFSGVSTLAATAFSADYSVVTGTKPTYFSTAEAFFGAPSGSGLFLDATHMGYYTASAWKTYISNTGEFFFNSTAGAIFRWNGTYLGIYTSGANATYNATASPFYVDTAGQFSLGQKLTFSGGTLTINGGGVFTGSVSIGTSPNWFNADSNGIWLGGATFGASPFRVSMAGALTATSGTFSGTLDVSTGLTRFYVSGSTFNYGNIDFNNYGAAGNQINVKSPSYSSLRVALNSSDAGASVVVTDGITDAVTIVVGYNSLSSGAIRSYQTAEASGLDTGAFWTKGGAAFTKKVYLGSSLHWAADASTYIDEDYGIQLHGDSTHPVRIPDAALVLGNFSIGDSYTAGRIYFAVDKYLYLSGSDLYFYDGSTAINLTP